MAPTVDEAVRGLMFSAGNVPPQDAEYIPAEVRSWLNDHAAEGYRFDEMQFLAHYKPPFSRQFFVHYKESAVVLAYLITVRGTAASEITIRLCGVQVLAPQSETQFLGRDLLGLKPGMTRAEVQAVLGPDCFVRGGAESFKPARLEFAPYQPPTNLLLEYPKCSVDDFVLVCNFPRREPEDRLASIRWARRGHSLFGRSAVDDYVDTHADSLGKLHSVWPSHMPPYIDIYTFARADGAFTLVTSGLSAYPQGMPEDVVAPEGFTPFAELVFHVPTLAPRFLDVIRYCAEFAATFRGVMDVGTVIPTHCYVGSDEPREDVPVDELMSEILCLEEDWPGLAIHGDKRVKMLWLCPISPAEARVIEESDEGWARLLAAFDEKQLSHVADPRRDSFF